MISDRNSHEPELGVDDTRVAADPAETGVLRVDALLHRPGIDVGARLELRAGLLAHPCDERVHALLDHVVVIVAPGVAGDHRGAGIGDLGRVRAVGVVDGGQADDRRARTA